MTGINSDKQHLAGTGFKYTQQNLTGNLGSGEDTVIVQGTVADPDQTLLASPASRPSSLKECPWQAAQKYVAYHNIKIGNAAAVDGDYIG